MKRSSLLLVPALALFAAQSARAGFEDVGVDAGVDVGVVHYGAAATLPGLAAPSQTLPGAAQFHIEVLQMLTGPQSLPENSSFTQLKSGFSPSTETDPQRRTVIPLLVSMESALKRHDTGKLHHALLQLAAALQMTPEEAQAIFNRYLNDSPAALTSVADAVAPETRGAAFTELRGLTERSSDVSSASRLDKAFAGVGQQTSQADAPVQASPAASAASGGSSRAAAASKSISKAFSSVGASMPALPTPAAEQSVPMRPAARSSVGAVSMQQTAQTLTAPSSLNEPALKAAAATPAKRGGLLAGSRLFDNNEAGGRVAPAAPKTAAEAGVAAQGASAASPIVSAGSQDAAAPQFNGMTAQAAQAVAVSTAKRSDASKGSLTPVNVPMPSLSDKRENGSGSGEYLAGPRMTFMKVAFPAQDAAQGGPLQTWALASVLALSGAAGLKLFLGKEQQ